MDHKQVHCNKSLLLLQLRKLVVTTLSNNTLHSKVQIIVTSIQKDFPQLVGKLIST